MDTYIDVYVDNDRYMDADIDIVVEVVYIDI